MRYFLNHKGGIVKYYDSDLALVQTVSNRDLLQELGVVKEDYETCKLMEGYYAIRYLGERLPRFWGDTRWTASLIEDSCGFPINRNQLAAVASRIQEGATMDDIVSLYKEIPVILGKIKEKTAKKLPPPYICHVRPMRIDRAAGNKDTNTFDFIRLEYVLYTDVKKEDVLKDVREHTRKYVDCATEYIASQKKFQKFGVPVNVLRLTKATLTRDMTLEFLFELKKPSV
ncbi:MAG: hypothetical protein SPL82_15770 [Lachnospiraceae bacterium]|nr:hypothetical protein [Lachnospiraceae bacterium]